MASNWALPTTKSCSRARVNATFSPYEHCLSCVGHLVGAVGIEYHDVALSEVWGMRGEGDIGSRPWFRFRQVERYLIPHFPLVVAQQCQSLYDAQFAWLEDLSKN